MDTQKLAARLDGTITIREMVEIMGGSIMSYPVIGNCITLNGRRHCERDLTDTGNISVSYEWVGDNVDNQTLCRIYIGHKHSGPMLSLSNTAAVLPLDTPNDLGPICGDWVWHNLYSRGNYGDNVAYCGTWGSDSRKSYKTATDALNHRDYMIGNIKSNKAYTESDLLLSEMRAFVRQFEAKRDSKGRFAK